MDETKKFIEQQIAEDIKEILLREVKVLLHQSGFDAVNAGKLEKYAKVYAIMMESHRKDIEKGVFGNMSDDELNKLDADLKLLE